MDTLVREGIAEERILDEMNPEDFLSLKHFSLGFTKQVREIRGSYVNPVRNLLDEDDDGDMAVAPPYIRLSPEFHPLDSGLVDVRLTMTLPPAQARWLEGLTHRLKDMYPGDEEKHDIGYHVRGQLAELMKLDTQRHGPLGSGMSGTVTRSELQQMKREAGS